MKSMKITDFTRNLNELAKSGKLNRAFFRTKEVQRTTQVLLRRRKNNPVLLGEAGVGKTAIVEEIAYLITENKVHGDLSDCEILELDINAMSAGTNKRGEYEERALFIVNYFKEHENHILMIDEIHNIIRSEADNDGGTIGLNQILKPALARGDVSCIGATTLSEYNTIRENDSALDRRFMPILIDEPDLETTRHILHKVKSEYEDYHGCAYDSCCIDTILDVSDRYFHYRQFPDKAIDIMDELGSDCAMKRKIRSKSVITKKDVVSFSSECLKIPVNDLTDNKSEVLERVKDGLTREIIGQNDAVDRVIKAVLRKECGMYSTKRPLTSFFFYGKSGVGKTQLAKTLAELYHYQVIRFDMTEYMESHRVSSLIGAPPGYAGFQDGGLLTNAIKKNPYSVVIFDEMEKAHPKIFNILLQIMEDGILTDNMGRTFSFKNSIIVMTSNAGSTTFDRKQMGFAVGDSGACGNESHSVLTQYFRPEFLNRIDEIVQFNTLTHENLLDIADKFIREKMDLADSYGYQLVVEDIDTLAAEVVSMSKCPRTIRSNLDKVLVDPFVDTIITA